MRWTPWFACVALGGCNLLFDASAGGSSKTDVDAPPTQVVDAPSDPAQLSVGISYPQPVFADAGGPVLVTLRTTSERRVAYRLSVDAGMFLPIAGQQASGTAEAGEQLTTIMWMPPTTVAQVRFEASALYEVDPGEPATSAGNLTVLDHGGRFDVVQPMARTIAANSMFAIPFSTNLAERLEGLGIQVTGSSAHVKLALYATGGNTPLRPGGLLAQTESLDIAAGGRIEAEVAGQPLLPGLYWVAVIADKPISVIGNSTNENPTMASGTGNFTTGPSNPWSNPVDANGTLGMYAILGPTAPQ